MLPFTAGAPPTASAMVVVGRPIHGSELWNFENAGPESAEKEEANAGPML